MVGLSGCAITVSMAGPVAATKNRKAIARTRTEAMKRILFESTTLIFLMPIECSWWSFPDDRAVTEESEKGYRIHI
jgi:hypothetical protein